MSRFPVAGAGVSGTLGTAATGFVTWSTAGWTGSVTADLMTGTPFEETWLNSGDAWLWTGGAGMAFEVGVSYFAKPGGFGSMMEPGEAVRYRAYWERAEGYPSQGAPYQVKTWHHPDGTIKTVQTYDEFGHAHRQYGLTERNYGPHQHNFAPRSTRNSNAPKRNKQHCPIDE